MKTERDGDVLEGKTRITSCRLTRDPSVHACVSCERFWLAVIFRGSRPKSVLNSCISKAEWCKTNADQLIRWFNTHLNTDFAVILLDCFSNDQRQPLIWWTLSIRTRLRSMCDSLSWASWTLTSRSCFLLTGIKCLKALVCVKVSFMNGCRNPAALRGSYHPSFPRILMWTLCLWCPVQIYGVSYSHMNSLTPFGSAVSTQT